VAGARFAGLYTHADTPIGPGRERRSRGLAGRKADGVVETAEMLAGRGIPVESISVGSTPSARVAASVTPVTEIRPGNYVYNDASQVSLGIAGLNHCALSVLATVVGRPSSDRIVVDSGSKALPYENPGGRDVGWGIVIDHAGLVVERLFEEHAALAGCSELGIGDRIRITPNHACTATNLHPYAHIVHEGRVERALEIAARGWQSPRAGS
jgi:D-serine deaminase-like pyridoxal phosphate-dependent protein